MLSLDEVTAKYEAIMAFLATCGEAYNPPREASMVNIFTCICSGCYLFKPGEYFVCWKLIDAEDIPKIEFADWRNLRPGNVLCVLDCGVKGNIKGMKDFFAEKYGAVSETVVWNRLGKGVLRFRNRRIDHEKTLAAI